MRTIFFFAIISLLSLQCAPTINQLRAYEMAEDLRSKKLYVVLKDDSKDIKLFKEYGETKKADHLEKEMKSYNQDLRSAFHKFYDFSEVEFVTPKNLDVNDYHTRFSINENTFEDKGIRYESSLRVHHESATTITVQKRSTFKGGDFDFLVKQLNNKLEKLATKAK